MQKTTTSDLGRVISRGWHAEKRIYTQPVIADTFTKGGIRYYKDTAGQEHVADIFDQAWGKRSSAAILPKGKRQFQRTQKF